MKQTCLQNLGVENPSQSEDIKNKKKETSLQNLGVEYPLQSEVIKKKMKQTCLQNLGVENPMQNQEVQEKSKQTCLNNFGVEYPAQSEEIKNKMKQIFINNYGVKNPQQNKEISQKTKNTIEQYKIDDPTYYDNIVEKRQHTMENEYGAKHALQVDLFFSKAIKNSFKTKDYILPSGTITQVQGDEPIALDELFENNYKEDDIITQYQGIEYEFENNTHKYYADIYIKSENKIIEVKSDYTMEKDYDKNMAKWEACIEQGYEFEFWIYDKKKNKEVLKL